MRSRTRASVLILGVAAGITLVALIAARTPRQASAGAASRLVEAPVAPGPADPVGQADPVSQADPASQAPAVPVVAAAAPVAELPVGDRKIQIALLLDTSSSMQGLIDQARSQLWKVVNEFARAKQQGSRPRLEIALYQYGNVGLPSASGWIQRVLPFTTDLDDVSEKLFALRTNGGDEYVGQVIQTAVRGLEWSSGPRDLKLVFVAGNEPFTQGPVSPAAAIALARERGIRVNAIHCGGDDPTWREGALLAKGSYVTIDHNRAVVHVAAPQDDEIARLGVKLNATYLAYGAHGSEGQERQALQDKNAASAGQGSLVQRSVARASNMYRNARWDLVDATREGKADLAKLRDEAVPEDMRKMTLAQRRAHVEAKASERAQLQRRIVELNLAREKHVRAELARRGDAAASTLDSALIKTVHEQGSKRGWRFE